MGPVSAAQKRGRFAPTESTVPVEDLQGRPLGLTRGCRGLAVDIVEFRAEVNRSLVELKMRTGKMREGKRHVLAPRPAQTDDKQIDSTFILPALIIDHLFENFYVDIQLNRPSTPSPCIKLLQKYEIPTLPL